MISILMWSCRWRRWRGVGYAGLVAAYERELDVLLHRLALENAGVLVVKAPLLLDDFSAVLNGFVGRGGTSRAGPLLAATVLASGEELGPRWLDVSARECLSGELRRPRPTTVHVASSEARGFLGRSGPSDVMPPRRRTSRTRFAYAVPSGPTIEPDDGVGIDANVNHCEGAAEASGNGKIALQ